ncbi:hypothetical protein [Tabrizicola sp.]|uniref:hypothetical protein n=1 Tax=Tabrizicola sp. TaxID=2005166 RepID=UPI002619A404|nr:hypothetical protein [Tabrizicola sp.]MDM7930313.1 hypothetical protein [Tabrizicola sp.]
MKIFLLFAVLVVIMGQSSHADHGGCDPEDCRTEFRLSSTSDLRKYGILIVAPKDGCHRMRFRVQGESEVWLGHTPPLGPGELAVVRMGLGFPPGDHVLTITAVGCDAFPATLRRVTLAKFSPDHGWRAAMAGGG